MEKKGKREGALVLKTAGFPFICAVLLQYMFQAWPLLSMSPSDPGWMPFLSSTIKQNDKDSDFLGKGWIGIAFEMEGRGEKRDGSNCSIPSL